MKTFQQWRLAGLILVLPALFGGVGSVMAAEDSGGTSGTEIMVLLGTLLGTTITSMIMAFISQRNANRAASQAKDAQAEVKVLKRDLGVDQETPSPDITKMDSRVAALADDLDTVKGELVTTLKERDTARELLNQQLNKNTDDNVRSQAAVDKLTGEREDERQISARLEQQISEYNQRFRDQELKMAHIEGRLDQQSIFDQLSNTMQTVAKLLHDTTLRLTTTGE